MLSNISNFFGNKKKPSNQTNQLRDDSSSSYQNSSQNDSPNADNAQIYGGRNNTVYGTFEISHLTKQELVQLSKCFPS